MDEYQREDGAEREQGSAKRQGLEVLEPLLRFLADDGAVEREEADAVDHHDTAIISAPTPSCMLKVASMTC